MAPGIQFNNATAARTEVGTPLTTWDADPGRRIVGEAAPGLLVARAIARSTREEIDQARAGMLACYCQSLAGSGSRSLRWTRTHVICAEQPEPCPAATGGSGFTIEIRLESAIGPDAVPDAPPGGVRAHALLSRRLSR